MDTSVQVAIIASVTSVVVALIGAYGSNDRAANRVRAEKDKEIAARDVVIARLRANSGKPGGNQDEG